MLGRSRHDASRAAEWRIRGLAQRVSSADFAAFKQLAATCSVTGPERSETGALGRLEPEPCLDAGGNCFGIAEWRPAFACHRDECGGASESRTGSCDR